MRFRLDDEVHERTLRQLDLIAICLGFFFAGVFWYALTMGHG